MAAAVHPSDAPAPFDAIATCYDDIFSNSKIGQMQRRAVWAEMDRYFQAGESVLEINCGTGIDALHLARRGLRVDACDASSGMIARARERVQACGFDDIRFRCLPIERIDELPSGQTYDGVVSNFSGLDCIADLGSLTRALARLVRPGGRVVVCVFGVFCLWEIFWYVRSLRLQKAFRRFSRIGVPSVLAPGATITVYYRSVMTLRRAFQPHFRLVRRQGVGIAVPPSYAEALAMKFPGFFRLAAIVDPIFGRCPLVRSAADHVVLTFVRSEVPL